MLLEKIERQARGRILFAQHFAGERHLELGGIGAGDCGAMVIDPVDARAARRLSSVRCAPVAGEFQDRSVIQISSLPLSDLSVRLLDRAVGLVVAGQRREDFMAIVKARHRRRRHHTVEA